MARVFSAKKNKSGKVIKCAKCGKQIKPGETYHYFFQRFSKRARGAKVVRCSSHYPRPSEMTQSEHMQVAYGAQEAIADAVSTFEGDFDFDSLKNELESQASTLEDHISVIEERVSNMEGAFPNGSPTLDMLNEYNDNFETFKENIESAVSDMESEWDNAEKELDVEVAIERKGELGDNTGTHTLKLRARLDLNDTSELDSQIESLDDATLFDRETDDEVEASSLSDDEREIVLEALNSERSDKRDEVASAVAGVEIDFPM